MSDTPTDQPSGQENGRRGPAQESGAGEQHGAEEHGAPTSNLQPAEALRLDNDRDLSHIGGWSLALAGVGVLIGITFMLAGGILPGALVVGLSLICALVGALFLALVAHHQG